MPRKPATAAADTTPTQQTEDSLSKAFKEFRKLPRAANYNALMLAMRQYQNAYIADFTNGTAPAPAPAPEQE